MSFFTSFLFVFYLQVMPPPPPTMNGGNDYWSGTTNDDDCFFCSDDKDWNRGDLRDAINNGFILPGGGFFRFEYWGYEGVKNGIRTGYYTNLRQGEWRELIQQGSARNDKADACSLAINFGGSKGQRAAERESCAEVPIPKWLLLISVLSFLVISYFHNRKDSKKRLPFKGKIE